MFLRQVRRNSSRNRRENGLYFASLIVAIVFSYILLSLGEQDVMLFLKEMESDAVRKLLLLIPIVYVIYILQLNTRFSKETMNLESVRCLG